MRKLFILLTSFPTMSRLPCDEAILGKLNSLFAYLSGYLNENELNNLRNKVLDRMSSKSPEKNKEEPVLLFIGPIWTIEDLPELRKLICDVANSLIKDKEKREIIRRAVYSFL